jgi:hypothetical protein
VQYARGTERRGLDGPLADDRDTTPFDPAIVAAIEKALPDTTVGSVKRVERDTLWQQGKYVVDRTSGKLGVGNPVGGQIFEGNREVYQPGRVALFVTEISSSKIQDVAVCNTDDGHVVDAAEISNSTIWTPTVKTLTETAIKAGRPGSFVWSVESNQPGVDLRLLSHVGDEETVVIEAFSGSDAFRAHVPRLEMDGMSFPNLDTDDPHRAVRGTIDARTSGVASLRKLGDDPFGQLISREFGTIPPPEADGPGGQSPPSPDAPGPAD